MRVSKKFYLCGRLQNAPTQHTLKVIDYQIYRLCQSFGTLTKFMIYRLSSSLRSFSPFAMKRAAIC